MDGHLVFVYGTLMQGEHHHDALHGAVFLGARTTLPAFDLVFVDYYPAMLAGGATAIAGELYRIDAAALARLDLLEEVPTYYTRERIALSDGSFADSYLMPRERAPDNARAIVSGDFRRR